MADIETVRRELVEHLLDGDGRASRALRAAAFRDERSALPESLRVLAEKIITRPSKVCDEDIAAARSSGLSEDQLFELVVCVAVGEATREYEAGLAALDAVGKS
jgi:alkylhydroperoxidase family enzyme